MASFILHTKKNWLTFGFVFIILTGIQFAVLLNYGIDWQLALWDAANSQITLAVVCLVLMNSLRFYSPGIAKYALVIGWYLVLAGIWSIGIKWLLSALQPESDYLAFVEDSIHLRFWIAVIIISCIGVVTIMWNRQQNFAESEKRKTDAETLAKEAELFKLRQQFQPHFLFNSLNSINALIGSEPAQARKMIHQLSDLLRGTLKKEDQQWVSLEEELQLLELYLDIEKVRFGHRLNTVIEADEVVKIMKMPPMLLQPVVENAIKFGLYDTTGEVTIRIKAVKMNDSIEITVRNPFDSATSSPRQGTGFGLGSLRRRLYLLYMRNDLLTTSNENNLYLTTIKIPQTF